MPRQSKPAGSSKILLPGSDRIAGMIAEAKAMVSRMAAPLYKSCLRTAVEQAEAGSPEYLEEQLPAARARLSRQDAEAKAQADVEAARIAAMASRTSADDVRAEYRKLRREQDGDYAKWGRRRRDERTARKAHLSNRLDGRARRMSDLDAMYRVLTGNNIGESS
jgi:hypothetical protein